MSFGITEPAAMRASAGPPVILVLAREAATFVPLALLAAAVLPFVLVSRSAARTGRIAAFVLLAHEAATLVPFALLATAVGSAVVVSR
jgi:predicted membrane protein